MSRDGSNIFNLEAHDSGEFAAVVSAFLDGMLSAEKEEAFLALLKNDGTRRAIFVAVAMQSRLINEVYSERLTEEQDGLASFGEDDGEDLMIDDEDRRLTILESLADGQSPDDSGIADITDELRRRKIAGRRSKRRARHSVRAQQTPTTRQIVIPRTVFYGGIAAILALAAIAIWPNDSRTPAPGGEDVAAVVATLESSFDAAWTGGQRFATGEELIEGDYALTRGAVSVVYESGARVIFEAPVSMSLDSPAQVTLHEGKLVGRCPTPTSRGFTVITRSAKIVDIGTEFGVRARKGGVSDVQVFDGEVRVHSGSKTTGWSHSKRRLARGDAVRVERSGDIIDSEDRDALVFRRDLEVTPDLASNDFEAVVLADKPLSFWRFNDSADDKLIDDIGSLGAHGTRERAVSFTGDSPNPKQTGSALDGHPGAGLVNCGVVNELYRPRTLTITAWVRADSKDADHPVQHEEFISTRSRTRGEGGVSMGVEYDGTFSGVKNCLFFSWPNLADWYAVDSPLIAGEWTHVAVTTNGTDVQWYINGAAVKTERIDSTLAVAPVESGPLKTTAPLILGSHPHFESPFVGDIDEIAIFDRILSADRIKAHYEASRKQ